MHFVTKKLHRDRHSTNPLLSTQCHGHDPEAADLAVYLAITVSTFIFLHIYTNIYIYFHMDNFFHKIICIFICYIVVVCSATYLKLCIGLSV